MKKIKVYYMGRALRDVYPHASRLQVIKWKVQEAIKLCIRFLFKTGITVGILYATFMAGAYFNPTISYAVQEKQIDVTPIKIENLKDEVINQISQLENKNNVPSIPDDNKSKSLPLKDKVSYGCMQFKISTIETYYKTLGLGTISDQDAASLGIDCPRSKALAKRVIFETTGGLWNWSVATKEMGTKVEIIKELEK